MIVREITVHAGRTLPHPIENYANIRAGVSMQAELADGEDPAECFRRLRVQAEQIVESHAAALIASIEERQILKREAEEISRIEKNLIESQQRLEALKGKHFAASVPSEPPLVPSEMVEDISEHGEDLLHATDELS